MPTSFDEWLKLNDPELYRQLHPNDTLPGLDQEAGTNLRKIEGGLPTSDMPDPYHSDMSVWDATKNRVLDAAYGPIIGGYEQLGKLGRMSESPDLFKKTIGTIARNLPGLGANVRAGEMIEPGTRAIVREQGQEGMQRHAQALSDSGAPDWLSVGVLGAEELGSGMAGPGAILGPIAGEVGGTLVPMGARGLAAGRNAGPLLTKLATDPKYQAVLEKAGAAVGGSIENVAESFLDSVDLTPGQRMVIMAIGGALGLSGVPTKDRITAKDISNIGMRGDRDLKINLAHDDALADVAAALERQANQFYEKLSNIVKISKENSDVAFTRYLKDRESIGMPVGMDEPVGPMGHMSLQDWIMMGENKDLIDQVAPAVGVNPESLAHAGADVSVEAMNREDALPMFVYNKSTGDIRKQSDVANVDRKVPKNEIWIRLNRDGSIADQRGIGNPSEDIITRMRNMSEGHFKRLDSQKAPDAIEIDVTNPSAADEAFLDSMGVVRMPGANSPGALVSKLGQIATSILASTEEKSHTAFDKFAIENSVSPVQRAMLDASKDLYLQKTRGDALTSELSEADILRAKQDDIDHSVIPASDMQVLDVSVPNRSKYDDVIIDPRITAGYTHITEGPVALSQRDIGSRFQPQSESSDAIKLNQFFSEGSGELDRLNEIVDSGGAMDEAMLDAYRDAMHAKLGEPMKGKTDTLATGPGVKSILDMDEFKSKEQAPLGSESNPFPADIPPKWTGKLTDEPTPEQLDAVLKNNLSDSKPSNRGAIEGEPTPEQFDVVLNPLKKNTGGPGGGGVPPNGGNGAGGGVPPGKLPTVRDPKLPPLDLVAEAPLDKDYINKKLSSKFFGWINNFTDMLTGHILDPIRSIKEGRRVYGSTGGVGDISLFNKSKRFKGARTQAREYASQAAQKFVKSIPGKITDEKNLEESLLYRMTPTLKNLIKSAKEYASTSGRSQEDVMRELGNRWKTGTGDLIEDPALKELFFQSTREFSDLSREMIALAPLELKKRMKDVGPTYFHRVYASKYLERPLDYLKAHAPDKYAEVFDLYKERNPKLDDEQLALRIANDLDKYNGILPLRNGAAWAVPRIDKSPLETRMGKASRMFWQKLGAEKLPEEKVAPLFLEMVNGYISKGQKKSSRVSKGQRMLGDYQRLLRENPGMKESQAVRMALENEDFPPIVRSFLGEVDRLDLMQELSAKAMAHDIAVDKMWKEIIDQGMLSGTVRNNPTADHRIAFDLDSKTPMERPNVGKQNVVYISQGQKDMFDAIKNYQDNQMYHTWLAALKLGKVAQPTSAIRNLTSIPFFFLRDGMLTYMASHPVDTLQTFASSMETIGRGLKKGTYDDFTDLAIRKGVINGGVAGELREASREALRDVPGRSQSKMNTFVRKVIKKTGDAYNTIDALGKLVAFQTEVKQRAWANGGKVTEDIINESADIINDTWPTAARSSDLAKYVGNNPLTASFVSFQTEMIRGTYNSAVQAAVDAKSAQRALQAGDTKRAGRYTTLAVNRVAGMAAALTAGYALKEAAMNEMEITDEQMDAFRVHGVYPDAKNSSIVVVRKNNHQWSYIDMGNQDPLSGVTRMLTSMVAGDPNQPLHERLANFSSELVRTYLPTGILVRAGVESMTGKQMGSNWLTTDRPTREVQQRPDRSQMVNGLIHFAKAVQPGFVGLYDRFKKAKEMQQTNRYSIGDEVLALGTGVRISTVNLNNNLKNEFKPFKEKATNMASQAGTMMANIPLSSMTEQTKVMEDFEKNRWNKMYYDMLNSVDSYKLLGFQPYEIRDTLKDIGLQKDLIDRLARGEYMPFQEYYSNTRAEKRARDKKFNNGL